jgi:hypothetical protein
VIEKTEETAEKGDETEKTTAQHNGDGGDVEAEFRGRVASWARDVAKAGVAMSAIGQSVVLYDCVMASGGDASLAEYDSVAAIARVANEALARDGVSVVQSTAAQFLDVAEKAFARSEKEKQEAFSGEIFLFELGSAHPYGRPLTYIQQKQVGKIAFCFCCFLLFCFVSLHYSNFGSSYIHSQSNWRVTTSLSLYAEPLTAFHWYGLRPLNAEETPGQDDAANDDDEFRGKRRKRAVREKRLLRQDHDAVYDKNMIEYERMGFSIFFFSLFFNVVVVVGVFFFFFFFFFYSSHFEGMRGN